MSEKFKLFKHEQGQKLLWINHYMTIISNNNFLLEVAIT